MNGITCSPQSGVRQRSVWSCVFSNHNRFEFQIRFSADKDENDEDEDDDDEDDDENDGENVEEGGDELGQEAKRQRLNQSPPSREPDTSESAESSAVVWMPAQPPSWQPRRRLLRGRRAIRGNRGSSNQLQNIVADDDDDIGEDQAIAIADPTALAQSVNIESIENATNAVAPSSTANSSSTANAATPSTASGEASQIPDGIDPSFLAALPEEMRDEVIAEHLRYVPILIHCFQV